MVGAPPPSRRLRRDALIERFAPTLGLEKSDEVVHESARKLGVPRGEDLRMEHAMAIVDDLSNAGGLVGVVARFVKARGDLDALAMEPPPPPISVEPYRPMLTPTGMPAVGRADEPQLAASELVAFFAQAMGDERAREVVASHGARIGAEGSTLSRAQVMALLEQLAGEGGIVGVVARFAKAKFILKLGG